MRLVFNIKQVWMNSYGAFIQFLVTFFSIILSTKAGRVQRLLLRSVRVVISGPIFIGRNVTISNPFNLFLGERVAIGDGAMIACHAPIFIGDDFLAAPGLFLNSGSHNTSTLEATRASIRIGARVWCGVRVTICAGVEIGDDAVIGAGAVVVKSIPSGAIAVGVPAKVIGKVDRSSREIHSWYTSESSES